jgi:hypothetical protein
MFFFKYNLCIEKKKGPVRRLWSSKKVNQNYQCVMSVSTDKGSIGECEMYNFIEKQGYSVQKPASPENGRNKYDIEGTSLQFSLGQSFDAPTVTKFTNKTILGGSLLPPA